MDMHTSSDSRNSAFTLIEVLVATAIAVGAAIAITSGATRVLLTERSAIQSSEGMLLLRAVEAARNNPRIAAGIDEWNNSDWSIDMTSIETEKHHWSLWTIEAPSGRKLEAAFKLSD